MSKHNLMIPIPYSLARQDLVIEEAVKGESTSEQMEWLYHHASWENQEEMERIFRATVCLFQQGAGTLGECLGTAIVWERG